MNDNEKQPKLKMLKDSISFDPDKKADTDVFSHSIYAETILLTLIENDPPFTIGLFGPWGIGKSFVMRGLFDLIRCQQEAAFVPIYFNAWEYSGDSFRRQFLIEVAEAVYKGHPQKTEKLERLKQLNYTKVLKEHEKGRFWETLKEIPALRIRFRQAGIVRILIALFILLVGGGFSIAFKSASAFWTSLVMAALAFILKFKFEDLILIQETPVYDPQMIFPEQFRKEFDDIVKKDGPIGNKKALIVIDDIDRCHPPTVRDILISIKTFLGHDNCFIIVPCDDKAVVKVFDDPSQKDRYKDESLRKYFDIGVRMAPIMSADLVDFATQVAEKTDIPVEVIQVGVLGNCKDGRKIKHFLNTFRIKRELASSRQIPCVPEALAKAIVIEDQFPDLFDRIVEEPDIYDTIVKAALLLEVDEVTTETLRHLGLEDWEKVHPELKGFLERTRYVTIANARLLFSLKMTNPEGRLPSGSALRDAIVKGEGEEISKLLKDMPENAGTDVANILGHLLTIERGTFLKNSVRMGLEICAEKTLVPSTHRKRICQQICEKLQLGQGPHLLALSPQSVIKCSDQASISKEGLIQKYETELEASKEMPDNMAAIVNIVLPASPNPISFAATVNAQVESWTDTLHDLEQIAAIDVSKTIKDCPIPSLTVLEKVAVGITTNAADAAFPMNKLRKDILLKNWQSDLVNPVSTKLTELLTQANSEAEPWTGERTTLVRDIILKKHDVSHVDTPNLWNAVKNACSRTKESVEKLEAHELVLVFAIHSTEKPSCNDAKAFVKTQWKSFDDEQTKVAVKQLRDYDEEERREVESDLMAQELSLCSSRINNPDDAVFLRFKFCLREKKNLGSDKIDQVLINILDAPSAAFVQWSGRIPEYAKKLTKGLATSIGERCLSLAPTEEDKTKKDALFVLFAGIVPFAEEAKKNALFRQYFELCRHDNVKTRTSALSALKNVEGAMDAQDFKLSVNSLLCSAARNISPEQLPNWWDSLQQLLIYKHLFGEAEWQDIAALAKNALSHSNAAIAEHGLALVEVMDNTKVYEDDLVHLLVKWAGDLKTEISTRCRDLLKRFSEKGIQNKEVKKVLNDYIATFPNEDDEAKDEES